MNNSIYIINFDEIGFCFAIKLRVASRNKGFIDFFLTLFSFVFNEYVMLILSVKNDN